MPEHRHCRTCGICSSNPAFKQAAGTYTDGHYFDSPQPELCGPLAAEPCDELEGAQARIAELETGLVVHWLAGIECDAGAPCKHCPRCACSSVDLGWHESVGDAVAAWAEHFKTLPSIDATDAEWMNASLGPARALSEEPDA